MLCCIDNFAVSHTLILQAVLSGRHLYSVQVIIPLMCVQFDVKKIVKSFSVQFDKIFLVNWVLCRGERGLSTIRVGVVAITPHLWLASSEGPGILWVVVLPVQGGTHQQGRNGAID